MATKKKVGIKVPSQNEILRRYGNIITVASETSENGLKLPSTFYLFNDTIGGGVPWGKIIEIVGEESSTCNSRAWRLGYMGRC